MKKEQGILKIVKEDILRILAENNDKVPIKLLNSDIKVSDYFIDKAVRKMARNKLISSEGQFLRLTGEGKIEAEDILKKHLVIEKYFEDLKSKKEAHNISNLIEHYISEEVMENLKKLSTFKEKGISLVKFDKGECLITDIVSGNDFFERLISMGVFPGEKIKIIKDLPNGIIFKIRNKKVFISDEIAESIRVLAYE
ncbi:MAG: iron dependent repressor, metal binding and dimerization domain protein [Actinomycetota bacterium]|nr:iron dependent repressor, metal binding and dimerization domain protein [Actinomycetota bacterium]